MQKTILYAGEPGDGYGWGVCNANLIRELGKLCTVWHPLEGRYYDGPLFTPIADHDLTPATTARGNPTIGYCFFEYELGPKAVENSKLYDLIFCGSTWCKERLAERGIMHTEVLIQGVDHEIFKPLETGPAGCIVGSEWIKPRTDKDFRIFSGGKFEYRKGQDIVLAAFKLLQDKYPQMRLVTAWFNPWPELIGSMAESDHILLPPNGWPRSDFWHELCERNEIQYGRCDFYDMLPQTEIADLMRSTDLGVFPNRCEGGTNLVLMEYLACGKPAIATVATGQFDIHTGLNYAGVRGNLNPKTHWFEVDPSDLARVIEDAYLDRLALKLKLIAGKAALSMQQWTWERAARQILAAVERFQKYGTAVYFNLAKSRGRA